MDSRLKGLSIESKNSHNRILTKELFKLQAMKKISNAAATTSATVFSHFRMLYKINMGGFETQWDFIRVQEHPKRTSDEEVTAV